MNLTVIQYPFKFGFKFVGCLSITGVMRLITAEKCHEEIHTENRRLRQKADPEEQITREDHREVPETSQRAES